MKPNLWILQFIPSWTISSMIMPILIWHIVDKLESDISLHTFLNIELLCYKHT